MDHDVAVRTHAAERYLLDEMPASERDSFEEHYFSCEACADDLRELTAFVDDAKKILSVPPEPWPSRATVARPAAEAGWRAWLRPQMLGGALATAFAALLVVQTLTIRDLEKARVTPAVVLRAEVRDQIQSFREDQPLAALIQVVDPPAKGGELRLEIRSAAGDVLRTIEAASPGPDQALSLIVPKPGLRPGQYSIVIGSTRYLFQITRSQ